MFIENIENYFKKVCLLKNSSLNNYFRSLKSNIPQYLQTTPFLLFCLLYDRMIVAEISELKQRLTL